jgi:V/A-type H+-transporting ATPase subunit D
MARLQLNKSSLAREQKNLKTYQRFLPSLDLKRQQLMAERAKARHQIDETRRQIDELARDVGRKLPMLANENVDLRGLVSVERVEFDEENVVGTILPKLKRMEVRVKEDAPMTKPHWVDAVVAILHDMLELRLRVQVEERRLELLDRAVKTITQRVNLFDKVLIPQARSNIKKIRIYLSDEEMAAVVRSKISKSKRAREAAS